MDRLQRYGNLLRSDGTNQRQRTLPALEPGYILPDERSLSDLLAYAQKLAAEIRFYTPTGQSTGDWSPFLEDVVKLSTGQDAAAFEKALQARSDWPPHVALFVVFLKLFQYLQNDLNELPQRHLRHYYENELNLLRREAVPDDVHVIFELARNAAPTLLPAQTLLDAGKDSKGRPLYYATQSELVVSAAKVKEIRRLVGESDSRSQRFFGCEGISGLEGESWYTFGRRQLTLNTSQRFMTEVEIGFAIASPILLMAEGKRTVTLKAKLRSSKTNAPISQGISSAFTVDLTGAKDWLAPETLVANLATTSDSQTTFLEMTLTLNETAPAIVTWDAKLHGEKPRADWPILRCRLNGASSYYETLVGLTVESATLEVSVKGVKQLVVQNDQGSLTPDKPMPLFGSQPHLGSSFYIGSAEVFSKHLTSLALYLEWQDLPDLLEHYRAYFDQSPTNFSSQFRIDVDLLYGRSWDHRLLDQHVLFNSYPTLRQTKIEVNSDNFDTALRGKNYVQKPILGKLNSYTTDTTNGFIRLVLRGPSIGQPYVSKTSFEAFGHQMFSNRYATQALALSRWDRAGIEPPLPNQPWTPSLANLSLDYTASVDMVPGAAHSEDAFFRLEPFGYTTASGDGSAQLIPEIDGSITLEGNHEFTLGALYLGIEELTPPANISLLFQIDPGTASVAPVLAQAAVEWSYLSSNTWKTLPPSAVLNDSTAGFQQPGLVVLSVGRDATLDHTLMPPGMVWLRALIRQAPESAARTLALHSQGALARFVPAVGELKDYTEHLQTGLTAKSIKRLKQRVTAVKSLSQPYRSFEGRTSETDAAFFRRCSERLRHRNRAVTPWDFERLVLEEFPEVFKVKCLPHSRPHRDADGNDQAGEAPFVDQAGEVSLIIVPDLRNITGGNPLEPRASAVLMNRISDYVRTGIASPFATVHVIHPVYERIRVDARVAFLAGLDAGYYAGVLNQELRRFLSPWAYEEGQDIIFGSQIYKSEILAFMEGRRYVDYITDFQLYHIYEGTPRGGIGDMTIGLNFLIRPKPQPAISSTAVGMTIGDTFVVGWGVEVAATPTHAILVSHSEHRITPINRGEDRCLGVKQLGIGYMTVGLDFNVSPHR
ncbi:MAG: hypothetical protein B0A82_26650 [Alkalinema sp. CACIAM 70d]|nr:MAG: hypothetical protein B0A82_26650 [Alkalinema sp. CACIAM 70d]